MPKEWSWDDYYDQHPAERSAEEIQRGPDLNQRLIALAAKRGKTPDAVATELLKDGLDRAEASAGEQSTGAT